MRKTSFCLPILLISAALAGALPARSQDAPVGTGSNINLTQYPGPNCTKPVQPVPPVPGAFDQNNPDSYNSKVRKYNGDIAGFNTAINAYNACMNSYVQNGNADMLRIKQALEAAIAAEKAP